MNYCIDTSALMDAWTRWYPPDAFPTLWGKMDILIKDEQLISSEEVLVELERKEGDSLYAWAKQRHSLFLLLDARIQGEVTAIMGRYPRLVDGRTGKSYADPFVIATAQVRECTVVTGEKATGKPNRPKIPDVCKELKIPCINFTDLIRDQGWRF